ncbi:MAG: hypothetical protein CVT68_10390 [Actinobacteria bacterium HGW-Actinobacteria-8]|nr:MAG: hypothetical protein CVT68_10390 [Actinobacteria bacterium HGW-Actinobacteria-8]
MDIGVLTVVAAILAVMSLVAWYRVMTLYGDTDGRGFRAVVAGLASILAVTAGYFEVAHHQRQELATEALGVLSDVDGVNANCERFSEELLNLSQYQGYVYYDGSNVAHLRRTVCHDLWDYAHGGQAHPTEGQIVAVHIVAHETMHINGIRSESVAECRAVQLNHLVAEALGATPEEARALQRSYYVDYYPYQRSDYVSGACAEGGELDIYAARTEFP